MQNSLLTHIASDFISEYENVANSSICYFLNEYSCARDVLKKVIDIKDVPTNFKTELSTKNNGRPDVTGLNENGDKSVIIEGKFWANLTDNQPNNYLKELTKNGKILFLTPEKRLSSLESEITRRAEKNAIGKIIIYSWLAFIRDIESENKKNHNQQLASDIIQFKELCLKMDSSGMPPLSNSDLDPVNGKRLCHFVDIIDECNSILRQWEFTNFQGTKTQPQKYGYGFYFYAHGYGCWLEFNNENWFNSEKNAPFWLDIFTNEWEKSEKINHYLKEYDEFNSNDGVYAICLQSGMDKNEVIKHIVNKTKAVITFINEKYNNANH